ncbi:MAG: transcriptional regulator SlyA [Methanoregulaceae archaeon PtaU1.Bin066]|jgi:DNA-binding MarR family transcriptional regulator|nr:MAG: transcriptional regulator SlyA [Methanoregulaceae archaeon PtaU1.Bin066]
METERITKKIGILYWSNQKILKKMLPQPVIPGQVAAFIYLTQDGEIRQDELVSKIGVDKAIGTRVIKKLDEGGYVRRRNDPEDRRVSLISLTNDGAAMKRDIIEVLTSLNRSLLKDFSEEEQETILRLLDRIIANTDQLFSGISEDSS